MNKLLQQILKFGFVGVICFFIDFVLYLIFNSIFKAMGLPQGMYLVAQFIGFIVSMIFNYILSMKYVFVRRDDISRKREFITFFVLSAIGLVINEIVLYLGVDVIYENFDFLKNIMSRNFAEVFFKLAATGVVMVYNFISRKLTLEKKEGNDDGNL